MTSKHQSYSPNYQLGHMAQSEIVNPTSYDTTQCREPRPKDQVHGHHGAEETTYTRPCTPVTPARTSRSNQHKPPIGVNGTIIYLGRAANSKYHEREHGRTPTFTTPQSPPARQYASNTKTANIRVRRSNHGSTLLQSPARAGYTSRMRQMFEEAGRSSILYPQLPNISRKASPPSNGSPVQNDVFQQGTTCGSTNYRLESLCLSTTLPLHVSSRTAQPTLRHPSERSSGSWSNDSGYIVTQPRDRSCSPIVPPNQRIHAWLLQVPDGEGEDFEHDMEMKAPDWSRACSLERHDEDISPIRGVYERSQGETCSILTDLKPGRTQMPGFQSVVNDLFMGKNKEQRSQAPAQLRMQGNLPVVAHKENCSRRSACNLYKELNFDQVNRIHTPTLEHELNNSPQHEEHSSRTKVYPDEDHMLEEGGIQLSPLSPNVCIERGPSRYHFTRKPVGTGSITMPCNPRPVTRFQATRFKENVILRQEDTEIVTSPLTPRSIQLGTRFRSSQ